MMKHTQGKWLQKQVKANDRPGKVTLIGTDYEDGHLGIATVNWTDDEEGQANANLIEAAATYKRVKGKRGDVSFNEATEEILLQYIEENREDEKLNKDSKEFTLRVKEKK